MFFVRRVVHLTRKSICRFQFQNRIFRTGLCEECKCDADNKDTANIISKAKDVKGVFDDRNNLIKITFESDGKTFSVSNERKDGYKNELKLEEE